ncbi:MAG: BTAD domain-containing putative transcriptional regulator, partial [Nakamurella sp.]
VDAWRFEVLVRQATEPDRAERSRELLQQALDLWRGNAYGEFANEPWAVAEAARLDGMRIVARERWCEAVLRAGNADEAVSAAELLTRQYPLREEGWRLLAMGLYAGGRLADALAALRRARALLADELGLDPGPALSQVENDVLAQRLTIPTGNRPGAVPAVAQPPPPAVLGTPGKRPAPSIISPGSSSTRPTPSKPALVESVPQRPESEGSAAPLPGSVEFIGRDRELNVLHGLAAQVTGRSAGRVSLIAGEAGAGKSRLLGQLADELADAGWTVVVGRCPESAGAPPAWAWVEVVRTLETVIDPGALRPALAPLLIENFDAAQADASFGRFLLGRAVTSYLTAVAENSSLAVILDDLHRADAETLALLETVVAGTSGAAVLMVAGYRPAEVQAGLRDSFGALAGSSPSRLSLDGLDSAQAARLIRSVAGLQPDEPTLAALVERTGGNPFYLTESARLLGSEGGLVALSRVPEGVRDVLRRRFARLPELTIAVLRLAAVIGRDVDIDVLLSAAEVDEETVLDALEAGVLAGLLSEPAPGTVRFGHVLVRDTLYDDAPRLRLARWHARVAGAIAVHHPADAAALAHHLHQSGSAATARQAVDTAVLAAEQAIARYAHDTAADLFSQALADLDRVPEADGNGQVFENVDPATHLDERVVLLGKLSRSELAAGAGLAATAHRSEAMRLAHRAGRHDLLVTALTAWDLPTPWIVRHYGVVDTETVGLLEQLLSETTSQSFDDAARCRLLCALVGEISGENTERAAEAANEAEAIARQIGDPVLIGFALHALGAVISPVFDSERTWAVSRELRVIGEQPGLAVFALIGHHLAVQLCGAGADMLGLAGHIEALQTLVDRYRWRQEERTIKMHRAMLAHVQGRLDEAEALYVAAGNVMRETGAIDADGIELLAIMSLRITQGRVADLSAALEKVASVDDVVADMRALPLAILGSRERAAALRRNIRPVRQDFFESLFLSIRGMIVCLLADQEEASGLFPRLLRFSGRIAGADSGSFAAGPVDT